TSQIRTLEEYCTVHTETATGRFVLAYHYLTQGHTTAAVEMLKQVITLKPGDTLAAKLLRQLDAPADGPDALASASALSPTTSLAQDETTPPEGASIAGTWSAQPAADTSITLSIEPAGAFTWQVSQKGRSQQFSGRYTHGDGILTLAQD